MDWPLGPKVSWIHFEKRSPAIGLVALPGCATWVPWPSLAVQASMWKRQGSEFEESWPNPNEPE